jgi:hypothetical protein
MRVIRSLRCVMILLCFAGMLGCGSTERQITSLALTPAVADSHSYPNGQVQYSASANYNQSPSPGLIHPALWALRPSQNAQGTASISQSGVAQCNAGAAGNFSVLAYAIADPNVPQTNQNLISAKKAAVGLAQLNCP